MNDKQKQLLNDVLNGLLCYIIIGGFFILLSGCGSSMPIKKQNSFDLQMSQSALLQGQSVSIDSDVLGDINGSSDEKQIAVNNFFVAHLQPIVTDLLMDIGAIPAEIKNSDYQLYLKVTRVPGFRIVRSEYNLSDNTARLVPLTGMFADKKYRAVSKAVVSLKLLRNNIQLHESTFEIDRNEIIIEADNGRLEARQRALELYEDELSIGLKSFFDSLN